MTVDEQILEILEDSESITNVLGDRIYMTRAPQNVEVPFLVFERVATAPRELYHGGYVKICESLFQFSCFGRTMTAAKELARKVSNALNGYTSSVGSFRIFWTQEMTQNDIYDDATGENFVALDINITHKET